MHRIERRQAGDEQVDRRPERDRGEDEDGGQQSSNQRTALLTAPVWTRRARDPTHRGDPIDRGGLGYHAAAYSLTPARFNSASEFCCACAIACLAGIWPEAIAEIAISICLSTCGYTGTVRYFM